VGLAAAVFYRRAAGIAGPVRAIQSEGIGSLEENQARKLGPVRSQHRFALEVVYLSHNSLDDDELCFPLDAGHVSDIS